MNLIDVLILALVGVCLFFALRAIRRGKGRCGGSCGACPYRGGCKRPQKDDK